MPRLLIVAYTFPPLATVGSERPKSLAKEAKEQGWDVRVLTTLNSPSYPIDPNEKSPVETIRAIHIPISYFTRWLKYLLPGKGILWSFMDYQYGWVPTAIHTGKRLYDKWPYDIVFATAPPFSTLRVGAALAKHAAAPSIADLRDPFLNNITRDFLHPSIKRFWSRYYYNLLFQYDERIIVDEVIQRDLYNQSFRVVRNGYNENEFSEVGADKFSRFTISSVGTLYHSYNLDALFKGLKLLPEEIQDEMRVLFVGKNSNMAIPIAKKYGISSIDTKPIVPRDNAIDIMRRSQVLIFFGADAIGTRIYEYARSGAMSIQIYDNESYSSVEFSKKHNLSHNVSVEQPEEIAELIIKAYRGESFEIPEEIHKFTRKQSAREILSLLNDFLN